MLAGKLAFEALQFVFEVPEHGARLEVVLFHLLDYLL